MVFFFQAEDGIRDGHVTGVQTCALPIFADAMLEATKPSDFGGAVASFMNSGGVRAGLLFDQISGGEQPGQVTYGEAFNVQPFGNTLVVKTCTGQQIYDVLNQHFNNPAAGSN